MSEKCQDWHAPCSKERNGKKEEENQKNNNVPDVIHHSRRGIIYAYVFCVRFWPILVY